MTTIARLESELRGIHALSEEYEDFSFRAIGVPPLTYICRWQVPGLEQSPSGAIWLRSWHEFVVQLGAEFPFAAPNIIWRTPILHPNIKNDRVCLGSIWYGGSSLREMCLSIRALIRLEDFNVFDPLDRQAASWLRERLRDNPSFVPLVSSNGEDSESP